MIPIKLNLLIPGNLSGAKNGDNQLAATSEGSVMRAKPKGGVRQESESV